MNITKTKNGFIVVCEIVKGYLITKTYQGYTIKEAKNKFKVNVKKL